MDEETLARVERQRLELETNVAKLRNSLRYWQTLEIDYEGLKEEFQGIPEDASYDECLQAATDFNAELVDDKELQTLLGDKVRNRKRPSQLVDLLSNRVEYVTRNISTIRKQLSEAEKKRNALLLAQNPEHQDDAGLPLGEIIEELDDDGKVISSKVQIPGKEATDLLDVLQKAGVRDIDGDDTLSSLKQKDKNKNIGASGEITSKPVSKSLVSTSALTAKNRIEELSDDEELLPETSHIGPTNADDTEEDAVLRQQMLQYGLGEVGAIVAELDLQDSANISYDEDEDDDYISDYDEDEDLYLDESEDEKGATKNPLISERYKRHMEALSKQHGITDLKNLGPGPTEDIQEHHYRPSAAEAARTAALARYEASKSSLKTNIDKGNPDDELFKKKKKVAFAPPLDIATETPPESKITLTEPPPIEETIVERTAEQSSSSIVPSLYSLSTTPQVSTTKKPSRFRAARSAIPQTPTFPPPMSFPVASSSSSSSSSSNPQQPAATGPLNRTISTILVERPASQNTQPTDPSDFNEELHRREVATEYQKMRNRKIHAQGGYVRGGEADNYGEEVMPEEEVDETTGQPKKISRFKAARLRS